MTQFVRFNYFLMFSGNPVIYSESSQLTYQKRPANGRYLDMKSFISQVLCDQ